MNAQTLDRLAADALRLAEARRRVPGSTYRLQMHGGFAFRAAAAITPYLDSLGVTHAYTSSLLAAKPGSTHGYDVMDPGRVNPEIGTEDEFAAWVAALHDRGMGLILDTVPNHMSVGCDNAWWADVLEHGPSSPFAEYFDIAWQDHPRERLHGKVLLPILGEPYGKAVDGGQFKPVFDGGAFYLELYGRRLTVDPRTYGLILAPALDSARHELSPEAEGVVELQSILTAIKHLPAREETDPARIAEGRVETAVIKRRLAELDDRHPGVAAHVHRAVGGLAGTPGDPASFAPLDQLLDAQAYRPCYWRVASDEINYRRFFDVNDLAALSTEREEVFQAIHRKLFDWLGRGLADGLRIDHPDGLYDPEQYLARVQVYYRLAAAKFLLDTRPDDYRGLAWEQVEPPLKERFAAVDGRPLFVVVEKILGRDERPPAGWAAEGATGYKFINTVNGLFVDPAREADLTRIYQSFTGQDDGFDEIVYRAKFLILQSSLASELHMLADHLDDLAQAERWSRDFTLNGLRHALREVIACFPVYRSYVANGVSDSDRVYIQRAIRRARARNPLLGRQVFDFIRDTLLLRDPPSGPASPEYREAQRRFAGKFQQVTAPVMAKGLEDTALYVFNRLVSLNEVGGEPSQFGRPPDKVHRFFRERLELFPAALAPLSTHDTKRSEDVRARINVLSELPDDWDRRLHRWAGLSRRHKSEPDEGEVAPDPNEEYFLYQTLLGAWPVGGLGSAEARDDFAGRIRAYMNKAIHEAKVHTSWINPDADYDAAVDGFVSRLLDPGKSADFLTDLDEFARVVSHYGMFNSLSQTLIRCTAPGVPDTYQGTELWDFSLVDPDNRRPVDYAQRERLLRDLDERAGGDCRALARELVAKKEDGRVKLYTLSRALRFRRENPELFAPGEYEPVKTLGARADHVFAYLRSSGPSAALVAVPRMVVGLVPGGKRAPLGPEVWGDTTLHCPRGRVWENVFTGAKTDGGGDLPAAVLFADFPVALLAAR
jgi:(1->4)-alpha-D-glucan 1-alpha-D-glucosylmutase